METLPINAADVVIALVIVISGVFAAFRGFVHEILAVVSWVGAALATLYGFAYVQPHVRGVIAVPLMADMAAGVGIFLLVLIALSILTRIVSRRIRASALGPLDRSLGLVFGFLRGTVLICVGWLIFAWLLPREDHPRWVTEAKARPFVERGGAMLVAFLPARLRGGPTAVSSRSQREAQQLRAIQQKYQEFLSPPTKGDAPGNGPGYNSRMRDEMRRAIEGIGGSNVGEE